VPRGGSVWLGGCWSFHGAGIDSRCAHGDVALTADGLVERTKVGRNSFYRLVISASGRPLISLPKHIYGAPAPTGRTVELLLIGNGEEPRRLA